jgi:hypothetical protein
MEDSTMNNKQGKLSASLIILLAMVVAIVPFLSIARPSQVSANGESWLEGYDWRVQVDVTENGGGAKDNYTAILDAFYNTAPVEADSTTQFLYRPATRYSGTYDRVYTLTCATTQDVTIKYLDNSDGSSSSPLTLMTSTDVNAHNGGSVIVLQHQGNSNDGTILVAIADWTVDLVSRRTDQSVDDTEWDSLTWGDENTIGAAGSKGIAYPYLIEKDDGTIWCFYQLMAEWYPGIYFKTLTLGANPDEDSWSSAVWISGNYDETAPSYGLPAQYGNTTHIGLMKNIPGSLNRYCDIMYIKKVDDVAGTATSDSVNELVDSGATFETDGVVAGWWAYNIDDNTHTVVTGTDGEDTVTFGSDAFPDGDEDYILYRFETGDGSLKLIPFDLSDADHTPEMVHESTDSPEHRTALWDCVVDSSGNPYLAYVDDTSGGAAGEPQDIYWAEYDGGWSEENVSDDTGDHTATIFYQWSSGVGISGADPYKIMAAIEDDSGYTQIQAYERVGGTWYTANGSNGTTAICEDGRVTQAAPGLNIRPCYVRDASIAGWSDPEYYEWLWFYYGGTGPYPETNVALRFAYPGYSSGHWIGFKKHVSPDFGDVRITESDGETPLGYNGQPWLEEYYNIDYWRASLWCGKIDIPADSGSVTFYVYHGNDGNTNDENVNVLLANALFGDTFDGSLGDSLNSSLWDVTNTVDIGSFDTMRLTGTTGARGLAEQKYTSYPDFPPGVAFRVRFTFSHDYCNFQQWGLTKSNTLNEDMVRVYSSTASNRLILQAMASSSSTNLNMNSMSVTSPSVSEVTWETGSVKYWRHLPNQHPDNVFTEVAEVTTNVPTVDLNLYAYEGITAGRITLFPYMVARAWTNPEPLISVAASGEQVSPPTVVANSATPEETSATLNGNVTSPGGAGSNVSCRGFAWDTSTHGTPNSSISPTESLYAVGNWTECSGYAAGSFSHNATSLTAGGLYYYRAAANTSAGWGWSDESTFLTKPYEPSGLTNTSQGDDWIALSWLTGNGSQKTMLRYKTGSYPSDYEDGTQVYFDTGSTANVTSLTCDTPYYFRAWSYATEGGLEQYSDSYSQGVFYPACILAPTVVTNAATSIEETTVTLNGNVTDYGNENNDEQGFYYDTDSGTPYSYNQTSVGSFGNGAFDEDIAGLTKGELYYFQAISHNSAGWGNGPELTFLTKPDEPNTFTAVAGAGDSIILLWNKGTGALTTEVWGKKGSYPATRGDGTLTCNSTETYKVHNVPSCGEHWYYRAWSYVTEGGLSQYSDTYDEDNALCVCTPTPTPTPPPTPTPTPSPTPPFQIWKFYEAGFSPKHLHDSYTGHVVLADLDPADIPPQLQGVWWYDVTARDWNLWVPKRGGDLTTLTGQLHDYKVLVHGACEWEIPLP